MTEGRKDINTESAILTIKVKQGVYGLFGKPQTYKPGELDYFVEAQRKHKQTGPDTLNVVPLHRIKYAVKTKDGRTVKGETDSRWSGPLTLQFRTTFAPGPRPGCCRCIIGGELIEVRLEGIEPERWEELSAMLADRNAALGLTVPEPAPGTALVPIRADLFPVAGGYVRPIFKLSKKPGDFPLLKQFHERQTPLNWAVGLAMFSLTDLDQVESGGWQEVTVADLSDLVFCLTERGAPRRGDHRTDILAEVIKLHTTRNWYYELYEVKAGKAWTKRVRIGSRYPVPELEIDYLDRETGKRVSPTDYAVRALAKGVTLEVKGRRAIKPDGSNIPALPADRFRPDFIRWRWAQSFNEDLLRHPALIEKGKQKGLPKKTTRGKTIRKGYPIYIAGKVISALQKLRSEGRSEYACRLLVALAHDVNRLQEWKADRVFRMLGILAGHKKPEDLVAAAVIRLKQPDIAALRPGSDDLPRTDPNPDRRRSPYYRFIRSPDYIPPIGITSRKEAEIIEAEYAITPKPAEPEEETKPKEKQEDLPGLDLPPEPIRPTGTEIRTAREAAGINLRDFARIIDGREAVLNKKVEPPRPNIATWSRYERGEKIRTGSIPEDTWKRVEDFLKEHQPPAGGLDSVSVNIPEKGGELSHKGGILSHKGETDTN